MVGVMGMDQEKDEVGPRTWGPTSLGSEKGQSHGSSSRRPPSHVQLGETYTLVGRRPGAPNLNRLGRAGPKGPGFGRESA